MAINSAPSLEQVLTNPPTDGITCVKWGNKSDSLLVTSWDKSVRLYDGRKNLYQTQFDHKAAVFDCCYGAEDTKAFSGGLDQTVQALDLSSGTNTVLGVHDAAVKCVEYSQTTGLVYSGGWDAKVNMWDPRSHKSAGSTQIQGNQKVYTMSLNDSRLVVGTSNRQVFIYDIRQMGTPEQIRESSLMNQTRCIRNFPNGTGYALSSIEGRVAIEFFDPNPETQRRKYAFKCHRKTDGKVQTLYPVNAIAFHPIHGTFATGGCDGMINVWDGENKKRICQYPRYATSIASMDFNYTGDLLAIAASYTFEEGEKDHPSDAVLVRTVHSKEVTPKQKKK